MDQKLLELARKCKTDWKKVAKRLDFGRFTPNFLKKKYKDITDNQPQKRIHFTETEDLLIVKYFMKFEYDWEKMADYFPRRTPIMLKNRYYAHIRKRDLLDQLRAKVIEEEEKGTDLQQKYEEEIGNEGVGSSVPDTPVQRQKTQSFVEPQPVPKRVPSAIKKIKKVVNEKLVEVPKHHEEPVVAIKEEEEPVSKVDEFPKP